MNQIDNSILPKLTCTIVIAFVSLCEVSQLAAQSVAQPSGANSHPEQVSVSPINPVDSNNLPDSPGALLALAPEQQAPQSSPRDQPQIERSQDSDSSKPQATQSQPSGSNSSQPSPQKPVGAAAAEAPNVSGIAASQPAGVAIAPAKQHRVRTLVLKTGAIVGACVAVGAVVALTAGTSSKPPGAH